ncbi:MAG: CBS domain-containing protein [Phycisphaeraceae bacterium]|nr:CBS domain-containing protein [Phycisphaeraceae bacterium]
MAVSSIMSRDVVTVSMDDSLRTVQRLFQEHAFHHLVVVEDGRVVGVISDRDLLKNVSPFMGKMGEQSRDRATLDRRVHQIMSRRLVSVGEGTSLADASLQMLNHRVSCLPVLDANGACRGIVTWRDMLIWSLRGMQADRGADTRAA